MSRLLKLAALALAVGAGSMAVAGSAAAKACINGICASSTDDGRRVNVYVSTRLRPYTHFNIIRDGKQYEVWPGQSFHFVARPGYKQYYSVQVCNKSGDQWPWLRSKCTGWVKFYHTTPRRS
jgi:hypothetical protein